MDDDDIEIVVTEDGDKNDEKAFSELTCPICFELLWSAAVGVTECGHLFHKSCWNTWDGRSNNGRKHGTTKCPLCQTKTNKFITIFGIDSTNVGNRNCSNSIRAADARVRELEVKIVLLEEEKSSLQTCLKDVEDEIQRLQQVVFQLSLGETKWKGQLQRAENKIGALQCDLKCYEDQLAQMKQTMEENRFTPEILQLQKKYAKAQAELCKVRETNRSLQEQLNVLFSHRSSGTTSTSKVLAKTLSLPSHDIPRNSSDRSTHEFTRTDNDNHSNRRVTTNTSTTQHRKGLHHEILENTTLGSAIKFSFSTRKPPPTIPSASVPANSSSYSRTLKKTASTALDALSYTSNRKKLKGTVPLKNLQGFQNSIGSKNRNPNVP
jgi:hypothetical protein